jgi:FemAB-related protein (PEP-CTERM system-associated)
MTENINYRLATEADSLAWDKYVDGHPGRTFGHRWHWSQVLGKAFGVLPRYCLAVDEDNMVGILPAVLMRSRLFGRFMISLPWLDYGGPLAQTDEIAIRLVDLAISLAKDERCRFVELRAVKQRHPDLIEKSLKYGFFLNLSPGEEEVWKSIDGKAKNQVRKAAKSGLEVQFGKVELLDDFYKIFSCNMRDLGTPVWPRQLFTEQFNYFPDTEIALLRLGNLPVAGALLIHYQDQSAVPSASAYRKYLNLSPNNMLYWEIIKRCINRGSSRFDFGRSSLNAGTYNFKKQWVKNPEPQTWQYKLLTIEELPELNPSNPKFKLAINIWKRLPLPLANALGPKIVTKLP